VKAHSHDKKSSCQAKDLVLQDKYTIINAPELDGKMPG
jgi:hypothetical protein